MSVFRRVLISVFGALCLLVGSVAFGAVAQVSADPPDQAQNDGNGNSDSPGPGHGNGSGQEGAGDSSTGGGGDAGGDAGGDDGASTAGGSSGSNPDGGGLDKPDCETAAEGCQDVAPRDGNNGCGNEAEPKEVRDDDNNGNCGGGQDHDGDEADATVAGAAAQLAWRGAAGKVVAAALAATPRPLETDLEAPENGEVAVMGASVEPADAPDNVDLDDLELARERTSRSGQRSLLALTGMALMTLLAIGLFTIGVGRLFRSAEGDGS